MYEDSDTGAILHDGNLERRWLDDSCYVCFEDWLADQISEGYIREA